MALAVTAPAAGRQVPVDLTGLVTGGDDEPLPYALVVVAESNGGWTDAEGRFVLRNVPPGEFRLAVEHAGYRGRAFALVIPDTAAGVIDMGSFRLEPADGPTAVVRGTVRNLVSHAALPGALVLLNGAVVAMTNDSGGFTVDSVELGVNHFGVRRVGYIPTLDVLEVGAADTLAVVVSVEPLPIRLDDVEIVADDDRTIYARGRLGDFYRRRRTTEGTFFVREDIEKYAPVFLSDVLRRAAGVRLEYRGNGRAVPVIRGCNAMILLDGMEMRGMTLDDIPPDWVEAIEVHRGAFTPVELVRMTRGRTCGVIAVWTR